MSKIALLGRNIEFTRLAQVHAAIGGAIGMPIECDVFDVKFNELKPTVDRLIKSYDGFFVTNPYKTEMKLYLDCGRSVNLVRSSDKSTFNTDGVGFIRALDGRFGDWRKQVKSVLVLGAGSAAYSVASALIAEGKDVYVLNRSAINGVRLCSATGSKLYSNEPVEMAVNCTPLGENGEDVLKALCVLPNFKYAFDLVYCQDGRTPFLRRCASSGAQTADGSDMLIYKAIEGDRLLFGCEIDVQKVFERVSECLEHEE